MINANNILSIAFNSVPHSRVSYRKFASKSTNDFGVVTQTFATPATVEAIVEPGIVSSFGGKCIELKDYKEMGLDWSRRYITLWCHYVGLENTVDRDGADQIKWDGRIFTVIQVENWGTYNGWQRCYCVEDKSATSW